MKLSDYSGYRIHVPTDPSSYGSDCTDEDADDISDRLGTMIESEFPGVEVVFGSGRDTGPDEDILIGIQDWIQVHWTAAL